jgi:hypothetical protein
VTALRRVVDRQQAAADLRALVHGIMPSALGGRQDLGRLPASEGGG